MLNDNEYKKIHTVDCWRCCEIFLNSQCRVIQNSFTTPVSFFLIDIKIWNFRGISRSKITTFQSLQNFGGWPPLRKAVANFYFIMATPYLRHLIRKTIKQKQFWQKRQVKILILHKFAAGQSSKVPGSLCPFKMTAEFHANPSVNVCNTKFPPCFRRNCRVIQNLKDPIKG